MLSVNGLYPQAFRPRKSLNLSTSNGCSLMLLPSNSNLYLKLSITYMNILRPGRRQSRVRSKSTLKINSLPSTYKNLDITSQPTFKSMLTILPLASNCLPRSAVQTPTQLLRNEITSSRPCSSPSGRHWRPCSRFPNYWCAVSPSHQPASRHCIM